MAKAEVSGLGVTGGKGGLDYKNNKSSETKSLLSRKTNVGILKYRCFGTSTCGCSKSRVEGTIYVHMKKMTKEELDLVKEFSGIEPKPEAPIVNNIVQNIIIQNPGPN